MNCWVAPVKIPGLDGDTAMEVIVFATMGAMTCADPLSPLDATVMVAGPAAILVANPAALIVTTAALEDVQFAVPVTSAVEPSL